MEKFYQAKMIDPPTTDRFILAGLPEKEAREQAERLRNTTVWKNDIYQVAVFDLPEGAVHLSIKRIDRAAIHDWRHLQQIKNELCGPEREAVEIYPAESRLVDTANQYHLWVLPPDMRVPFGFEKRLVLGDQDVPDIFRDLAPKAVQRPFEK